jgi:hypothetical protein
MRNNSVAVQTQQPKYISAVSGRMPSRTTPEGQSAIDNSKVAIANVAAEIAVAATNAARTDGMAAAVVVGDVVSAMQGMSHRFCPAFGFNAPLTKTAPTIAPEDGPPPWPGQPPSEGADMDAHMDLEQFFAKTPATLDEIRWRVTRALDRHPLCRNVEFDIVSMPRTGKSNWTISLRSVAADALWEASDIVADIQEAYDLAVAA